MPEPYPIVKLRQVLPTESSDEFIDHPLFSELDAQNRGILMALNEPPTPNHFEIRLLCNQLQIEIPYYGVADTALGSLLERFTQNISWIHRHYQIALDLVTTSSIERPIMSTFTKCKVCGASSVSIPLCEESLLVSFAKLIELICYAKLQLPCGHSLIDGIRYFETPLKSIQMSVETVLIFEACMPHTIVKFEKAYYRKALQQQITYWQGKWGDCPEIAEMESIKSLCDLQGFNRIIESVWLRNATVKPTTADVEKSNTEVVELDALEDKFL